MNILILLLLVYFFAKILVFVLELHIFRKEIQAVFFLSRNIDKSLYKKEAIGSHHLIYGKYDMAFYDLNPNKVFIKKNDQHIPISMLQKTSFIGFLFKIKCEKLEKQIVSIITEYKNTKPNNSSITGNTFINN